jgi:hypothetical protein
MTEQLLNRDASRPVSSSTKNVNDIASRNFGPLLVVGFAITAVAFRALWFIYHYSANILWWDQWDFWEPLLYRQSLWKVFDRQHGPIREGVGLLFAKVVADLSHWNTQADTLSIGAVVIIASIIAVYLKYRLVGTISYWDAIVPVIFLSVREYEIWVVTPNQAHGPFPILLLMLYCVAWTIKSVSARHIWLMVTTVLMTFTGFAIFIVPIHVFLVAVEIYGATVSKDSSRAFWSAASLVCTFLAVSLFLKGYVYTPPTEIHFPYEKPMEYLWFLAAILANFIGRTGRGIATMGWGLAFLVISVVIVLRYAWRMLRHPRKLAPFTIVVFTLLSFTLIYAANAAVGRVFLGPEAPLASRYVLYIVPLFFGLYLELATWKRGSPRFALLLVFAFLICDGALILRQRDRAVVVAVREGKLAWKNCYLKYENISVCDQKTNFKVYPLPEVNNLAGKLRFLKSNGLNLYSR